MEVAQRSLLFSWFPLLKYTFFLFCPLFPMGWMLFYCHLISQCSQIKCASSQGHPRSCAKWILQEEGCGRGVISKRKELFLDQDIFYWGEGKSKGFIMHIASSRAAHTTPRNILLLRSPLFIKECNSETARKKRCTEQGVGQGCGMSVTAPGVSLSQHLHTFTSPEAIQSPSFQVCTKT